MWAKDVTLNMLGRFGAEGANYRALEYSRQRRRGDGNRRPHDAVQPRRGTRARRRRLLEADEKTFAWLKAHGARTPKPVKADADANYVERIEIDASQLAAAGRAPAQH